MLKSLVIAVIAIVVTVILAQLGATSTLGAHPVAWPVQVAIIGAPVGAIVGLILAMLMPVQVPRIILFMVLMFAAYLLAEWGHKGFAESYAEDATAGKFWYFGWIATCAAFTGLIAAIANRKAKCGPS